MNSSFVRLVSRLLVVCMLGLPFQVNAGMIGTGEVVSAAQAATARDTVATFMNRTDVAAQLQALGLSTKDAKDRVAALTDSEVAKLAGQIDSLPAGAGGTTILFVLIIVGLVVWWASKQ